MASIDDVRVHAELTAERVLAAATRVAMIATDLDGLITNFNSGAERMLGYSATEMVGKRTLVVLHVDAELASRREELRAEYQESLEGFDVLVVQARRGGCDEHEWTFVRKDGSTLSVYLIVTAVTGEDGQLAGFLGTAFDCTAQKRAKEALIASEWKYRKLIENSHDIIYSLDADGVFLFVGRAWTRLLGHPVSDVEHHCFTEFVHPEDVPACFAFLKKTIETGERQDGVEYRVRHANGSWRWHMSSASPIRDASGRITHYDGIGRDVTERKAAEDALRRSEANLQAILANTTDIIASYDRLRRLVVHNQASKEAFSRIIGVDPSPNSRVVDVAPRELRAFWDSNSERALSGESFVTEFELPAKGGGTCVIESSYCPIRQGSEITGFMTTTRDVTQRKQAEMELREREQQFRTLFDNAPYGCSVTDLEGRYVMANRSFGASWGLRSADILGRTAEEIGLELDPEDAKRISDELGRCGQVDLYETSVTYRDVSFTVLLSLQPIDFGGKKALLAVTVDITEKRRTEQALRRSEERFRLLLQNSNDILSIVDEWGSPILVQGPTETVFGYHPEEMLEGHGFDAIHPDDIATVKSALARTLAEPGRAQRVEYRARRKDGSVVWIEAVGNNLLSEPTIGGIVLNARDITARKLAEVEREKLQAQLVQAQKMESVGRLAGGVAHDFNNMLSVILGHVELALETMEPEEPLYANLEQIREATNRSADLTRQLLAFARKQTIAPKVLDLNETVEGMLKMLRRLIGEDIELEWRPAKDAGLLRIDPSQIDQILANLSINARDAMPGAGKLVIETGRAMFDGTCCAEHLGVVSGEYALLSVTDNGSGMDAATKSRLFEPFFTTKGIGKGTGLGLATVFGIVSQNNGFINVYSEPGCGTTFKVYLPSYQANGTRRTQTTKITNTLGTETILLVEDEPAIRQVIERMLRRLGYAVIVANTPGDAIELARETVGPIDLLLTDVVMPEMNGRDLAKSLLALRPTIKQLFVSGYTANVIAHHGVLDEGVHFLQKPLSLEALAAKLREVLDGE